MTSVPFAHHHLFKASLVIEQYAQFQEHRLLDVRNMNSVFLLFEV